MKTLTLSIISGIILLCASFFTSILLITPTCVLAQVENEETVTVNGTNFTLNYTITGNDNKIAKINLDTAGEGLVIFMNTHSNGNFTITLPRELIDAKINGTDTIFTYHEVGGDITALTMDKKNTSIDRTITISFGQGNRVIDLVGSHVIPEFSFPLGMVLPISIIVMILIYSCFRSRCQIQNC